MVHLVFCCCEHHDVNMESSLVITSATNRIRTMVRAYVPVYRNYHGTIVPGTHEGKKTVPYRCGTEGVINITLQLYRVAANIDINTSTIISVPAAQ